ncbi:MULTISPECIES: replication initiation protein [Corynebacterium]|uniref:replication initiation protein n=1 Tax=Corynebacterium TaxID=1716 RepID=UPI001F44548B|nr:MULTISPECIES: replication initiation protein [Corynebacterium]
MALLAATSRTLGGFLDHDPNFTHRFSRSPFYTGENPDRYIWYRQRHRIDRLSDFISKVREVADEPQHVSPARSSPVAVSSSRRSRHAASRPRRFARSPTRSKSRWARRLTATTRISSTGCWCAGSTRDAPPATRQPFATP